MNSHKACYLQNNYSNLSSQSVLIRVDRIKPRTTIQYIDRLEQLVRLSRYTVGRVRARSCSWSSHMVRKNSRSLENRDVPFSFPRNIHLHSPYPGSKSIGLGKGNGWKKFPPIVKTHARKCTSPEGLRTGTKSQYW